MVWSSQGKIRPDTMLVAIRIPYWEGGRRKNRRKDTGGSTDTLARIKLATILFLADPRPKLARVNLATILWPLTRVNLATIISSPVCAVHGVARPAIGGPWKWYAPPTLSLGAFLLSAAERGPTAAAGWADRTC